MENIDHLSVPIEHQRDIVEYLFPKTGLWKHWKTFGTFFRVLPKVLDDIEDKPRKHDPRDLCEEEFLELVAYLMDNQQHTFSKMRIHQALQRCHSESARAFREKFHLQ